MDTDELLAAIRGGRAHAEWAELTVGHNGHSLRLSVFRDAMKFDGVPALFWSRKPIPKNHPRYTDEIRDGVRLPVTAVEMQMVADLCHCMLPTPKVVDLLWEAAGASGTQFDSVVNINGQIVARSDIFSVHDEVEEALAEAGGDKGGVIDSVGKYWVVCKALALGKYGKHQAVNYGWPTRGRGNGPGVTRKVNVWQTIGSRHDDRHIDPSQTIRLMYRLARLKRAGASDWEDIDLYDILKDSELAPLISHEGPLSLVRQAAVEEPQAVRNPDGSYTMPEIVIFGNSGIPSV